MDTAPICKKEKKIWKIIMICIGFLPVLLKLYEKRILKEMSKVFENIFSKNKCEFGKGHNTLTIIIHYCEFAS